MTRHYLLNIGDNGKVLEYIPLSDEEYYKFKKQWEKGSETNEY